jgi:hypothetical protein
MSTVSLNAVQVVKSELPATLPKREYGDFDRFVANVDKISAFLGRVFKDEEQLDGIKFEWLQWDDDRVFDLKEAKAQIERAKNKVRIAQYSLREFPSARKCFAECKRDEKWYYRKELYEIKGKGKRKRLSRRVVSEQIALLLGSFQNARPGTPKVFGRMLTEEVYAANPSACVLESACRQVRRERDFPPSIAEVLKAIKEETSAWCDRSETLELSIEQCQHSLEKYIAEAEVKIAEAEPKLAEREAREKAVEEKRKAYRESYERIPKEQRWAYEHGQRDRSYNQNGYRQGPQRFAKEYMDEGREAEAAAYFAGCDGKQIPGLELKTDGASDQADAQAKADGPQQGDSLGSN